MKKKIFLPLIGASALIVLCIGSLKMLNSHALTANDNGIPKTSTSTGSDQAESPGNKPSSSQSPIEQKISFGDKVLIEQEEIEGANNAFREAKQQGAQSMAEGDFAAAEQSFQAAVEAYPNAPETLIYLNNAKVGARESYTIAIAVPIKEDEENGTDVPKEMLRGIAQSQKEINEAGGIKGKPLRVLIADDDEDEEMSRKIAQALADNASVLAVVGHFTSDTSLAASDIYQEKELVMISPTSTSVALSTKGDYIFRSLTSDSFNAAALVRYMRQTLNLKKAAIFYNSQSDYSNKLREVFKEKLFIEDGGIVEEFDLAAPDFDAETAMNNIRDKGADTVVLFHNSGILETALEVVKANTTQLPILSGDSGYKPEMLALHKYTEDILTATVPWNLVGNENSPFAESARALWRADVSWRTATSYDATQALIEAIKLSDNRSGIKTELLSPTFEAKGVAGNIRFQGNTGDRDGSPQLVTVGQSGSGYSFVLVQK